MSRYLPPVFIVIGFGLAVGACLLGSHSPAPASVPCTCRQLHSDPGAYAGKVVRVGTAGTEVLGGQLVWRPVSPGEPAVVFTFTAGRIPDPLPREVVGYCRAPIAGGPVRVTECRPAP
jgi:hypothetical protein